MVPIIGILFGAVLLILYVVLPCCEKYVLGYAADTVPYTAFDYGCAAKQNPRQRWSPNKCNSR